MQNALLHASEPDAVRALYRRDEAARKWARVESLEEAKRVAATWAKRMAAVHVMAGGSTGDPIGHSSWVATTPRVPKPTPPSSIRAALRRHEKVVAALDQWWQMLIRSCASPEVECETMAETVGYVAYLQLVLRLRRALMECDGYEAEADEVLRRATMEKDRKHADSEWAYACPNGATSVSRPVVLTRLFDLADGYTVSTTADEYANVLTGLFAAVTEGVPPLLAASIESVNYVDVAAEAQFECRVQIGAENKVRCEHERQFGRRRPAKKKSSESPRSKTTVTQPFSFGSQLVSPPIETTATTEEIATWHADLSVHTLHAARMAEDQWRHGVGLAAAVAPARAAQSEKLARRHAMSARESNMERGSRLPRLGPNTHRAGSELPSIARFYPGSLVQDPPVRTRRERKRRPKPVLVEYHSMADEMQARMANLALSTKLPDVTVRNSAFREAK